MRNPEVPEALDGWAILHRMFRFERHRFAELPAERRDAIAREAMDTLETWHGSEHGDVGLAQMLGAKCDLMLTHYARTWDDLAAVQTRFDRLALSAYLVPTTSYVSVLEVGLYEATAKIHADLRERGLTPSSPEWNAAFDERIAEQARGSYVAPRLWAKIPSRRYVCFYPMDKRRGETANWYVLPYEERARMMREHGKVGRSYAGLVTQVISGSIGFDDWEWGVDLYADDPLIFKKLITEMRYDEVSARYAAFGPFHTGVQFSIAQLPAFFEGESVPRLIAYPARM